MIAFDSCINLHLSNQPTLYCQGMFGSSSAAALDLQFQQVETKNNNYTQAHRARIVKRQTVLRLLLFSCKFNYT